MNQPRVLLVDPSDTRDALAERVRMQGYVVTVASDPVEGAHLALSDPPAIVVADLWMPGISGIQLCRLLRSEAATESVPVILRGTELSGRDRFWAERAGAVAYVVKGRMGDLARALASAIAAHPPAENPFFTLLAGGEVDLRDRIAQHLDTALFESVIASEVRSLGACGSFERMFDLLSQFMVQVSSYRWLALWTEKPARFALHAHPAAREVAEREARRALRVEDDLDAMMVEDEDALADAEGAAAMVETIRLGDAPVGRIAFAGRSPASLKDRDLLRVVAREIAGAVRITALIEESHRLAMVDSLTGLLNRRAFIGAAGREVGRFDRHGVPLCVLLLDVDHFKAVNDERGHASGDVVLTMLGRLLPRLVRKTDVVGRWGGEEFVVALTCATVQGALDRAECVRAAIAAADLQDIHGNPFRVTASIGLASCASGMSLDDLVAAADRAMYAAKKGGRNRVTLDDAKRVLPGSPGSPALHEAPGEAL